MRCQGAVKELSGGTSATTNNRMELLAAIEALRVLRRPCEVEIFTDSQYLRQGITEWLVKWKAKGWKTVTRQPVKNEDLWRALDEAVKPHQITWRWLKGHAGHADNERCDALAGAAMAQVRRQFSRAELQAAKRDLREASHAPVAATPALL